MSKITHKKMTTEFHKIDSKFNSLYVKLKAASKKMGIKIPREKTINLWVLIYLYYYYQKPVTKSNLTSYVNHQRKKNSLEPVNDVQAARHLPNNYGWDIRSGQKNETVPLKFGFELSKGKNTQYCLVSIDTCYSAYKRKNAHPRSASKKIDFEEIKKEHLFRCATCGCEEGKFHYKNQNKMVKLQKGHMDPTKPLDPGNIIPQCDDCNRAYRDWYIFDGNGRVKDINIDCTDKKWIKKLRKHQLLSTITKYIKDRIIYGTLFKKWK